MSRRFALSFFGAFLLLATAAGRVATAQDAGGERVATERRQLGYRVAATTTIRDSVLVAILDVSRDIGPFIGSRGRALSVYQNGDSSRQGAVELGLAEVFAANDTLTFVTVGLVDTTAVSGRLYTGDIIEVATDIPVRPYRSIFFELISSAISFGDASRTPMYERREVLESDSPDFENEVLLRMAADIRETAEDIRPMIPDNPQWDVTINGGRFDGSKMVDVMAQTEPGHVYAFLGFVSSFPGKYYGRDWKINETYATWLINAAPFGQREMRDSLLASVGTARHETMITSVLDSLADGIFTNAWNATAQEWAREGRIDEAYTLSDIVAEVARRLGDDKARALMLFSRADIAEEDDDYDAAVTNYTEAVALFRSVGDTANEGAAANNLGLALNNLDRYEEALQHFDEAVRLKQLTVDADPSSDGYYNLAGSHYGRGSSLNSLGRLDEALEAYHYADSLYTRSGSSSGLRNAAQSRVRVGASLRKLGRVEEALANLQSALETYASLGDDEGQADAYDELGLIYSQQQKKELALETYSRARDLHLSASNKKDAGFSLSQIGQVYWQIGDYDKAIESHRGAIALRAEANDRSGSAYSWLKLAGLFKESGNAAEAIRAYQEAASIYEEIGNRSGQGDVLESLGDLYKVEGDLPRAIQIHERALAIREAIGARESVATSLSDLADAYFDTKDFDRSRVYYQRTADLRREIGDKAGLARALSNLGLISHFYGRDYDGARAFYDEAINLARTVSSASDEAFSFAGLGRVSSDAGDLDAALEAYGNALELYTNTTDRVNTLLAIGNIHRARGDFESARKLFVDAEKLARDANSRHDIASALSSLGDLDRLTGDIASSLQRNRESLRLFDEVENPWGIAGAHIGIGNTLNQMGANQLAVREYELADSLYGTVQSELARATPANNIGTIYYHQRDYDAALPYFLEALRIQDDAMIADEFQVIILSNIGEVHLEAGRLDEAEPWLLRALQLSDTLHTNRIGASVRSILGRYYTRTENLEKAESTLTDALLMAKDVGESVTVIDVQTRLGDLSYRLGRIEEARTQLSAAVDNANAVGYTRLVWEPLHLLGTLEASAGNPRLAIDHLKQSVEALEDLRRKIVGGEEAKKVFTSGDRGDVYEDLIALLLEQGEIEQAMGYVERSLNEELRRRLSNLRVEFTDPTQAATYEEGKALESRLDQLKQRVAVQRAAPNASERRDLIERLEEMVSVAESDYNRFVNITLKSSPELARHFSSRSDPSQFFRSKNRIPSDAAVLAYLLGDEKLYIFVATREAVTARVLNVGRAEVSDLVRKVYQDISASPRSASRRGAGAAGASGAAAGGESTSAERTEAIENLYRILIGPIEAEIYRKRSLAVMPSGHLFLLPFQLLSRSGATRDALVQTHTVFYVSDLDVFLDETKEQSVRLVAFGNADHSLPNAEIEVNDIATLFEDARVYVGDEATEARAKEAPASYNVLHLATHGMLDFSDFEKSYLTLASSPGSDDGRLTLSEIWGMSTLQDYRLVTLSACRSAVNDNFEDGWPVSPATAFFDVGVSTVIASLWEVDDTATSLLMREFYGGLQELGAAAALRRAQQTLMATKEFSHPYYWAPFVATGDWR